MRLDEVMQAGLEPEKQHVVQFETRSLRDARQLLASVSLADATQFIEQNPHPRYVCSCVQAVCKCCLLVCLIASESLADATQFIEQNPHPSYVCLCTVCLQMLPLDVPDSLRVPC